MRHDKFSGRSASWDDPWERAPRRDPTPQDDRFDRPPERPLPQNPAEHPTDGSGQTPPPQKPPAWGASPVGGTPPPYVYPKKQRKRRSAWPIILVLAIFLAIAFAVYGCMAVSGILEDWGVEITIESTDPDSANDFDDWFHQYGEETAPAETEATQEPEAAQESEEAQCYLERAETGTGVTLTTVSREGKAQLSYEEIYAQNITAVVSITCYLTESSGSTGTGILFSSDGYIVTNAHVVKEAQECYVTLDDGSYYPAKLVGMDTESDLAVLKIDAAGLPTAEFGDSDELVVGNGCVAIGNPLGQTFRGTMTTGIISAMNRNVEVNGYTMTLIQTDCAINSGNSGGPLINLYGQVVGICNMKMMSTQTTVEGLGFAIPSNTVKTVVNKLIADGEVHKAMLGITASNLTQAQCQELGIDCGIRVATVSGASDAYVQGIQVGDVITAVDGIPVTSVSELNAYKGDLYPGDSITLTVLRDGVYTDYVVTLMEQEAVY